MSETYPEIPLSDIAWLTALARTLTRDGAEADDLVQETWMAARESPPTRGAIPRPWLARVLRNFHLRSVRSKSRRAHRESAASRAEALPATAELVQRAELHESLAASLLSLDEPYRRTLMLVAFEDQKPRQIAEKDGVPVAVVRRRLRKARELLKVKLEQDHGRDWSEWRAALLPFAALPLPHEAAAPVAVASTATTAPTLGGTLASSPALVAAGLVVGTGAALWLWSATSSDTPDALVADLAPATSSAELGDRDFEPARRDASSPVVATTGRVADAAPLTAEAGAKVNLTGSLVVRGEAGVAELLPNGEFRVTGDGGERRVAVRNGTWTLALASDEELRLAEVASFGGRDALLAGVDEPLGPFGGDAELGLGARWLPATRLTVLDAETREPLSGLTVVKRKELELHPGEVEDSEVVERWGISPMTLEPWTLSDTHYSIRGEGYGWHSFQLDPRVGGERELLLERGESRLTLRVVGEFSEDTQVSLRPLGDPLTFHDANAGPDGVVTLGPLVPGTYLAGAANPGEPFEFIDFDLVPGENEVVLELQPEIVPQVVAVTGTLSVPPEWGLDAFTLIFEDVGPRSWVRGLSIDSLERDPDLPGTWRFDAGELELGTYVVEVAELGWVTRVDLSGRSAHELVLAVPPPGTATFRVTDASTGEVVGPADVRAWWKPEAYDLVEHHDLAYDEGAGSWRVTAPQGSEIGIQFQAEHLAHSIEVRIDDLPTEREIELRRTSNLVLELFDGDAAVPPEPVWWAAMVEVVAKDGGGEICGRDGFDFTTIKLSEPGTYEVVFPTLEGFQPIPKAEVVLQAGETLRHAVQLERL